LNPERVEKLKKSLKDVSPAVRQAAAGALERLEAKGNVARFAAQSGR
jgi:hypothetical protein